MLRRTRWTFVQVLPPKLASFCFSNDEAKGAVFDFYHKKWFGTNPEYLEILPAKSKYLPFYACDGRIEGHFTAEVQRTRTRTNSQGKSVSETYWQYAGAYDIVFPVNSSSCQVYAGYKYNKAHLKPICTDKVLTEMHAPHLGDLEGHTIHLFEMNQAAVGQEVIEAMSSAMEESAKARVRESTWFSNSIRIHWGTRQAKLKTLQPMYCPAFVVPIILEENKYKCFVSGVTASVAGPYLINAVLLSRMAAAITFALSLILVPNKLMAIGGGLVAGAAASFSADYICRRFPRWRRDREKHYREKAKAEATSMLGDETIRVNPFSSAFETSSWRTRGSLGSEEEVEHRTSMRLPADVKGYYKRLGLRGHESEEEVKSQYRRLILKFHPDTSGNASPESQTKVAEINEAYRVIRDPKRRKEYDQLC